MDNNFWRQESSFYRGPILVRNHFLLRGVGLRHGEDISFSQFVIFIHVLHEKLYESPSIRLQNDNAPKNVVWGRTWYVSTNAMLYCISHYYTRLLRFVIKDILEMPTSTLNKYAKKKVTQNNLLENVKDGNAMIFFCHY